MVGMPCIPVTVEEPEPDSSDVEIKNVSGSSPAPNELSATYTVENVITAGNGETRSVEILELINGTVNNRQNISLSPGESKEITTEFTGVIGGRVNFCAEFA